MAFNLKNVIAEAKKLGPDMTQATSGGGYTPPAEGFAKLRFVGYYELGQHENNYKGQKSVKDKVEAVFELSGPKYPVVEFDGEKRPVRMTVRLNRPINGQLNVKSQLYKLFTALNYKGTATHIAELLGEAYVGNVRHNVGTDGKTYANLEDIRKPAVPNPETGEDVLVNVEPAISEPKLFLWDFATPEMWDSIFIPGEYPAVEKDGKVVSEARSRNVIQNKIKAALNFKASPIFQYATGQVSKGAALALEMAIGETSQEGAGDPLAGVA